MRRFPFLMLLLVACDPDEVIEASQKLLDANQPVQACEVLRDGQRRFPRSDDVALAIRRTCPQAMTHLRLQAQRHLQRSELAQARAIADVAARILPTHPEAASITQTIITAHIDQSQALSQEQDLTQALRITRALQDWRPESAAVRQWIDRLTEDTAQQARRDAAQRQYSAARDRLQQHEYMLPSVASLAPVYEDLKRIEGAHLADDAASYSQRGNTAFAYLLSRTAASRDPQHHPLAERYLAAFRSEHALRIGVSSRSQHPRNKHLAESTQRAITRSLITRAQGQADLSANLLRHAMQCQVHTTSGVATHPYVAAHIEAPNPVWVSLERDLQQGEQDARDASTRVSSLTQRQARVTQRTIEHKAMLAHATRAHAHAHDIQQASKEQHEHAHRRHQQARHNPSAEAVVAVIDD
jgi:hypothetical protein